MRVPSPTRTWRSFGKIEWSAKRVSIGHGQQLDELAVRIVDEHAHAFAAILNGGHHGGDTLSSMVDGSTGRRSFEAWYTAKHSCSARMAISPVISGCVPSSSPSTNALDMRWKLDR